MKAGVFHETSSRGWLGRMLRRSAATVALSAFALSAGALALSADTPARAAAPPASRSELPGGGRTLFPARRLVGFCGTPGAPALGSLTGDLSAPTKRLRSFADQYRRAGKRPVLPVFELIAVVGQGAAGDDGMYRRRVADSVVDHYMQAAREAHALLLLDIQPGRSDFLTESKHFERWLREPDVGLALDPEWAVKGKDEPGEVFGHTTAAMIDDVAAYLSGLVKAGGLPEKALVYHRVTGSVVEDARAIRSRPGVAIVQSVDGLGPKAAKRNTYALLVKKKPKAVHSGIKLFFDEDTRNGSSLMTPEEVLALTPTPEYVMYE